MLGHGRDDTNETRYEKYKNEEMSHFSHNNRLRECKTLIIRSLLKGQLILGRFLFQIYTDNESTFQEFSSINYHC